MTRQTLKTWRGKIVGFIDTDEFGNKTARDFYGKILGTYDKRLDLTKDFYGKTISRGDVVMSLIDFTDK